MKSWLYLFTVTVFLTSIASAHTLDEAVLEAEIEETTIKMWVRLPKPQLSKFDLNHNGRIEGDEVKEAVIAAELRSKIEVFGDDGQAAHLKVVSARPGAPDPSHTNIGLVWNFDSPSEELRFRFQYFVESDDDPRCLASFSRGGSSSNFVFSAAEPEMTLSDKASGFWGFTYVGMEHILEGYDHILFLAVLLLAGGSGAQLLKMVTAFTVAHSVTLGLAVLDVFSLPGSIVEPVIALSIVVAAIENIRRDKPDSRWMLAGGFGLIHGMGFAGVLADMSLSGPEALVPLLGFNVGVEAGQLILIFFALPLYYFVSQKEWNRKFRIAGSALAGLLAIYWTLERVLG